MKYKKIDFTLLKNIHIWRYMLYLILLYLAVIFFQRHKTIFTFFILLFLASISRIYNHFFWLPQLGFELYSTSTILTGLLLGPWYGLLQGLLSNFFAYFFSGKIKYYTYISMTAWGIIGLICGLISSFNINITILGVGFVIIYEIITVPIFVISGARISSAIFHMFTHILLTIFIFRTFVPILYTILR